MAKRSQMYQKLPWNGGINDSVDPGVLNDNDLVTADNVVFATSGSRLKREGLSYLDTTIPTPDLKSSSGTAKTIKWTTNSIKQSSGSTDELLVDAERVTITGDSNYNATEVSGTVTFTAQVATFQCPAASAITENTYFLLPSAEGGTKYLLWFDKGTGVAPTLSGYTATQVDISGDTTANEVASTLQGVIDGLTEFSASVSTDTVTATAATAGYCEDPTDAGSSGVTITVTTQGSANLAYTGGVSSTETDASASALTVARAEDVLCITDYWRTDSSNVQQQRLVSHTNYGKMFYYDGSNNRIEIPGQPEVSTIVCGDVASLSQGDFFTIYSANDGTQYDVWCDIDAAGTSAPSAGGTNVVFSVSTGGTNADVATAVKAALDGISGTPFVTTRNTATLTVTNSAAGATTDVADGSAATGFTFTTTTQGATLPVNALSTIRSIVFNNKLIHTYSGIGNLPTKYRPEDSANYQKLLNAPDAEFMTSFLSRLWCNDKTDPHRLHYSTTANEEEWNGTGDSGALDVYPGDGDPVGITAIYTYKGALFVAKQTKIYRIVGDSPENFQIIPISGNLGSEGSMVVNVEQDDAVFVSKRGFHSAQATDQFGDVSSKFISAKIQNTFNTWTQSALKNIQGVWIPKLNSLFFGVPASDALNSELWALNTELGSWYRWPSISCQAVSSRRSAGIIKPVFGTSDGRVIEALNGTYTDFGSSSYIYRVKTGRIYPGSNPQSMKAFKRIGFYYKPLGDFTFTVKIKIDNYSTQAYTFSQESPSDKLGSTFILGASELGVTAVLAPYMTTIDGYGRGLSIEIEQASADEQVEIYGFIIEYEEEGFRQEVISGE